MNAISKRLQIINDSRTGGSARIFAILELVCMPLSFITVFFLIILAIDKQNGAQLSALLPTWVKGSVIPIATAAAIGYITNWLAIQMLFRPYDRKKWLFFWPQGLLPRNQAKIAHTIGLSVVNELLKPEKLVSELNSKIHDYLEQPQVLQIIKEKVINLASVYGKSWASAAINQFGSALEDILAKNITPESICSLWDNYLAPKLQDEEIRTFFVERAAQALKGVAPELSGQVQTALRRLLEQKLDKVPEILGLREKIITTVLNFADEEALNQLIITFLGRAETLEKLKQLFVLLGTKMGDWIRTGEARDKLSGFSQEIKDKILAMIQDYLRENAGSIVLDIFQSPELWQWIGENGLPYLQQSLTSYINDHRQDIVDKLQLDQRIETTIRQKNAREFHEMIDKLAAEHLGAIQVLGYFLGAAVGALQLI